MKAIAVFFALLLITLFTLFALAASNPAQSGYPSTPVASITPAVYFFLPVVQQNASLSVTSSPTPYPTVTLTPSLTPTPLLPDLEARCCEVQYYHGCPYGSPGRISGSVVNYSQVNAGPFVIEWDSNGGLIGHRQLSMPGLAAKDRVDISWEFDSGLIWYAYIWADINNQVEETNEYNNHSTMPTGTPPPECTPTP